MRRHKTVEGQLAPLQARRSENRQAKRDERADYRSNMAKQHAITRGMAAVVLSVMQRGFFGRLRWFVLGR